MLNAERDKMKKIISGINVVATLVSYVLLMWALIVIFSFTLLVKIFIVKPIAGIMRFLNIPTKYYS